MIACNAERFFLVALLRETGLIDKAEELDAYSKAHRPKHPEDNPFG